MSTKEKMMQTAERLWKAKAQTIDGMAPWGSLSELEKSDAVIEVLLSERKKLAEGLINARAEAGHLEWTLSQRIHMAQNIEEVLRPFVGFAHNFVERDPGTGGGMWACSEHRQMISTWFGPSDFAPLLSFEDPNAEDKKDDTPAPV